MLCKPVYLIVRLRRRGKRHVIKFTPPTLGLLLDCEGAPYPDALLFEACVSLSARGIVRRLLLYRHRDKIARVLQRVVRESMPCPVRGESSARMSPDEFVRARKIYYPLLCRHYGWSRADLLGFTMRELDRFSSAASHMTALDYARDAGLQGAKVEVGAVALDSAERDEVDKMRPSKKDGVARIDPRALEAALSVAATSTRMH